MPEPTGVHAPITNLPPTEATTEPQLSAGSLGLGDELAMIEGAVTEDVPFPEGAILEAIQLITAPDTRGLSDIGVATYGVPPFLEAVIGTDERRKITDTQKYPWRINVSLLMTAADNSQWIGTGWFISPRTLVTAGHCVYIRSNVPGRTGWVKKIVVMPGRDGDALPFGSLTATEFWTVKGWVEQGLETTDYGAIILPAAFSPDLGFFAYGVFDDDTLLASTANVSGYPSDKDGGSTQWYDFRQVASVNPDKVYYAADTAGGQSGACVYTFHNGVRTAIAVHAYGGNTTNSGTRISSPVFANLESWKRT